MFVSRRTGRVGCYRLGIFSLVDDKLKILQSLGKISLTYGAGMEFGLESGPGTSSASRIIRSESVSQQTALAEGIHKFTAISQLSIED